MKNEITIHPLTNTINKFLLKAKSNNNLLNFANKNVLNKYAGKSTIEQLCNPNRNKWVIVIDNKDEYNTPLNNIFSIIKIENENLDDVDNEVYPNKKKILELKSREVIYNSNSNSGTLLKLIPKKENYTISNNILRRDEASGTTIMHEERIIKSKFNKHSNKLKNTINENKSEKNFVSIDKSNFNFNLDDYYYSLDDSNSNMEDRLIKKNKPKTFTNINENTLKNFESKFRSTKLMFNTDNKVSTGITGLNLNGKTEGTKSDVNLFKVILKTRNKFNSQSKKVNCDFIFNQDQVQFSKSTTNFKVNHNKNKRSWDSCDSTSKVIKLENLPSLSGTNAVLDLPMENNIFDLYKTMLLKKNKKLEIQNSVRNNNDHLNKIKSEVLKSSIKSKILIEDLKKTKNKNEQLLAQYRKM